MSAVRPGASPLVEIASVTPSRRTTPLRKAVALAGSSTALTKIRRASAACRHLAVDLRRRRRDHQPRAVQVARTNGRFSIGTPLPVMSGWTSGDTTRTSAPASMSCVSFPAATGPPPTSTTRRPVRFTNNGRRSAMKSRPFRVGGNKKARQAMSFRAFAIASGAIRYNAILDSDNPGPRKLGTAWQQQQRQTHAPLITVR